MTLKKPCDNCPFLKSAEFAKCGLTRAPEIAACLAGGDTFTCHQTSEETGTGKPEHCYGAMVVLANEGNDNSWMQIAERLWSITVSPSDLCYSSLDEWEKTMTEREEINV